MDHNSYKELLSALLDGELNETERAAALAHLAECEECRTYFAELTAMHDALNDLDEAEPPADFAAGVLARLHEDAAPQKTKKRGNPWRSWAALAACAAVAALAILLPGKGMGKTATSSSEYASAAPTAYAPAETESSPADYYGFAGETYDGYGAADDVLGEAEASLGTSQMVVQPAEGTTGADSGYAGMSQFKYHAYSPNGNRSSMLEVPAEDTAPSSPAEDTASMSPAPKPSEGNPAEALAEDPVAPTFPPGSMTMTSAEEPSPTLTLVGDGAAEWLAEHAEPLGGGLWRVSVEAVNELPDTLELVGLQEPIDGMLVILFETPENP